LYDANDNRIFSLPEIKKYAPLITQRGLGFISYDPEGISPDAEEADPVAAVRTAKQYADLAGIQLTVAPSQSIVSSYAGKLAIISLTGSYSSSQFDMVSI
jgi:hypothetical protein